MKKLVVMLFAVAVAAVSQAASFKWSATGVTDASGSGTYSGAATIYAILKGGDGSVVYSEGGTFESGAISKTISSDDLIAGNTYTFWYEMTDASGNTFKSIEKSTRANANTTPNLTFGGSGEWTAVPEPTSALLLLVGGALVALRRKRV